MNTNEILQKLESLGSAENIAGMARFAIKTPKIFGVSAPEIKKLAREIGKNRHELALELWETGFFEARILASLIDNPHEVSSAQMENQASDFDNWAICDAACGNLFRRTNLAYSKVFEWVERDAEFTKRAGFALIAQFAVHDKKAADANFLYFLELIENKCDDERNFVKKAVNWALRQVGKRNLFLHQKALESAFKIQSQNSKAARWIAADAIRELSSEKIIEKLARK